MPGLVPGIHVLPCYCEKGVDGRNKSGHDGEWLGLRLSEQADETGGALGLARELGEELVLRQSRRQFLRIEIGGDQREGVVVRTRSSAACRDRNNAPDQVCSCRLHTCRNSLLTSPSAKPVTSTRNAVGHPVNHSQAASAFRIVHDEREALGAGRHIGPGRAAGKRCRRRSSDSACCCRPSSSAASRRP